MVWWGMLTYSAACHRDCCFHKVCYRRSPKHQTFPELGLGVKRLGKLVTIRLKSEVCLSKYEYETLKVENTENSKFSSGDGRRRNCEDLQVQLARRR